MTTQITANNITNNTITATQLVAGSLSPKIKTISICDSSYTVLDDTAANTTGGYIQITGSTFGANSQVIIGTNNATSVTYVNTSTIRAQVPAAAATSYPVYVIDTDTGGTAIKINGLTHSSFPAWSTGATLSNQAANTAFGVSLSATSDSNITYSNTSVLPTGTSLLANGYFSGTVTIGAQTTYSFDVKANDAENQDASRTFSVTVTITSKRLWRTGYNNFGQMGTNDLSNLSSFTQMGLLTDWEQIGAGQGFALAVKKDGTLWSWGNNDNGQLGSGSTVLRSSPVQVGTATDWSRVSAGTAHALAVKTDGTLWAWGAVLGSNGQLGRNTAGGTNSPVQIGSGTNWNKIAVGPLHSLATKTDGTLWSWGGNSSGGLGLNLATTDNRSSPVQVGTGTNWNLISASSAYAAAVMATKTDGTLWTWGMGLIGHLGLNDRVYRSSPVQVGVLTTWSNIDIAHRASIASRTDGTLWSWGRNANGEGGVNDRVYRSSPTQVGGSTDWNLVGMGTYNAGAIKTNGTLWLWGRSSYGQIAYPLDRSSPAQIGSATNWVQLNTEGFGSWAIALN